MLEELLRARGRWVDVEPELFLWEHFGLDHTQRPLETADYNLLPRDEQVGMCKDAREVDRLQFLELQQRWYHSMILQRDPLRDRMTLFWHGLFTTSMEKNKRKFELIHQLQWLRRGALGSYAELLHGLVRDPAMLQYLDNTENRDGHANENLARELMELYSLGEGHYGEPDVREAARALTGHAGSAEGTYEFLPEHHDPGTKTILGVTGAHDADDLVEILLARPRCAEFVAGRLLRHLEGVEPSEARRAEYAAVLRDGGYGLEPFLRRLLLDPEFYRPEVQGAKVSAPIEFLVGVCRKHDLFPPPNFLYKACSQMGQAPYMPPSVAGWPDGLEWLSVDAMLARSNVVQALVSRREGAGRGPNHSLRQLDAALEMSEWNPARRLLPWLRESGARTDAELARVLLEEWLAIEPPADTVRLVGAAIAGEREARGIPEGALLESAEHFDPCARALAHLVFSLPEAQLR